MEIEIYVRGTKDLDLVNQLTADALPDTCRVRGVDLSSEQANGVPGEVLNAIMKSKGASLPLTLIDGQPRIAGRIPSAQELRDQLVQLTSKRVGFTDCNDYEEDTSVQFPTRSRVHMNLIVKDVAEAVRFYTVMFGQPPTKDRGDYAKFELEDPPINLALMSDPHGGAHSHFGIQVKSSNVIKKSMARYLDAGFHMYEEKETACCYAKQTKTWVVDPAGNQWEIFVTTDDAAQEGCAPDCICYTDMQPSTVNS